MPGRFVLDTNIIIALFAEDAEVTGNVRKAREIFLPSIVLGELYYGARKSANTERNLERLDDLAFTASVLTVDTDTAKEYGRLKNELRAKGTPIPENDLWIAALARQHGFVLVSRDEHFNRIEDIELVSW